MQKKLLSLTLSFFLITGVATSTSAIAADQMQLPSFTRLVKQVGSSVVNITADVSVAGPRQQQLPPIDPNDPFYQFFSHTFPNQQQRTVQKSFGSGFILSDDGYILTNAHVVAGAKKIIVKTTDKQELVAKLVGTDPKIDIALLKVNGKDLQAVKIGDPGKLEIGEWVAAIGAPFGFENTVTQGIVSAKGRNLPDDNYVPFIQSDVPINPGNSGGPLFNLDGEVVGINSQIYSRSGGYMGLSFSIPIDIAMNAVAQLKQSGRVQHGLLGVQARLLTQEETKSLGLDGGALVAGVVRGSSGERAGIRPGDVILEVGGTAINSSNSLPLLIGSKKPGDTVPLLIYRNGAEIGLNARLGGGAGVPQ